MTCICSFAQVGGTGDVQGLGGPSGSSLEDAFVGTAAHYTCDTSYSLQYLLSPSYSVGAFGAEAAVLLTVQNRTLNHILAGLQHPALACSVQWGGKVPGS